ncbi:hypothetical protein UFOVP250_207 [uncultured Caudovirales phage]|uniref:Uncharacterized protein n=1 Tax=uncultured Caudovirales phage TaxID=2100421 RepID=A0A6J5LKH4_9CAUD|nr:hypothetical protein UFOVP250_207 [uncultured Caudovirales phage]
MALTRPSINLISSGITTANIVITDTTTATSNITGALQVRGGVGVTGNVYASDLYLIDSSPLINFNSTISSRTVRVGMLDLYNMHINGPSSGYLLINAPGYGGSPRVGVGTITPNYTFDVTGTANVFGQLYSSNVMVTASGKYSYANANTISAVYTTYNQATNSLDTIFG